MAVLPDYVTGTIMLAAGSTTVTGTGTMFETAAFRPGDTLQIQNLTAIIASVDSNTSLTLTEPWTGTSLTNAPYRARYLPDGARVTAQTTTLIEVLGNGVLSNIASVPVEDGNLLVGNASGQYEPISKDELGIQDPNGSLDKLAALTLAARQILQTDGAGALTGITLAARQILQSDQNGALKAVALAANKLINTDDNGDILLSDITPFARTLLDDANGAAMWATMGASSNSNRLILPDGRVFMMGTLAAPSTGYGPVTFPTSFPNNCFGVVSSLNANVSASYTRTITTFGHNQSGFSVVIQAILNGGTLQFDPGILFNYFAWGN